MTRRRWTISAIVAAVVIVGTFALCRPKPTPLPPDIRYSVDSEKATRPAFDSSHKATTGAVTNVVTKIVRDEAAIAKIRAEADRERARADSMAREAARAKTADDSAERWRLAYESSSRDAAGLRIAVDSLTHDLSAARDTLVRTKIQFDADSARIAAAVHREDRMVTTIERSDPPCRIAHVFGCPSRKVVFVGGAMLGAAGMYAATHRSQIAGLLP